MEPRHTSAIRISGADIETLRQLSSELQAIFREQPLAARVRNDWGQPAMTVRLKVDPDRADLSGVTDLDVALSASCSGLFRRVYGEKIPQLTRGLDHRKEGAYVAFDRLR